MDTLGGDLKRLSASYENLEIAILSASDSLARDFIESLIKVTNAIANLFGDPGNSAEQLRERIALVKTEIADLEAVMIRTAGTGSKLADALETTGAFKLAELRNQLKGLQALLAAVERQGEAAAKVAAAVISTDADKRAGQRLKSIKAATKAIKDQADALSLQIGKLSVSSAEWERLTALRKALLITQKAGVVLTTEEIAQLVEQSQRVKDLAVKFGDLTDKKKKAEEASKALTAQSRELGFTFASAFEDAILKMESLGDVFNALLRDLARVAIRRTITEPLTDVFSAVVKSFLPGFRHGTQFKVGGTGGADSKLVAFRASPRETVTVSPPGAQAQTSPIMVKSEMEVNVFAPPGSQVQTQESFANGVRRLDVILDEKMARNITPGTRTFRALQASFSGLSPTLVGR